MKRIFTLLSFTLISTFMFAQPLVTTYVGTGSPGYLTGSNPRLSTPLDMPYGVAMDSKGNLWISEEGGNGFGIVIIMVHPDGSTTVRAGGVGESCFRNGAGIASRFDQPRGLAVDANDNIYVADFINCAIRKISKYTSLSSAQTVSTYAGKFDSVNQCYTSYPGFANGNLKTAQFGGPSDIAIDKTTGAMYVADAVNNSIRKIFNGQVTTLAGLGPDSAGFRDGPTAKAKFNFPTGVFEAANGDVYIADHMNSRIRKISGGTVSTVVFDVNIVPDDVWVTANGDIYFSSNYRICKYSGTTLSTYAGSTILNDIGDVDGIGTTARFEWVKCLIADNTNPGIFYVADQNNHKIKKVVNCTTYIPTITVTGKITGDTVTTCTGDSITLTAPAGYQSYSWSTGKTTQMIVIKGKSTINNITCTTVNNNGCQGVSKNYFVRISDLNPTITPNGPTTFCPGGNVLLTGPSKYDWYKWTKNGILFDEGAGNKQSILVTTADTGKYVLIGTVGACVGPSAEVYIHTSSTLIPDVNILQGSKDLCDNDTLKLEVNGTFNSQQWKKGGVNIPTAIQKTLNITTAGTYTVFVTSGTCSGTSKPLIVTIRTAPPKPTITITTQTTMTSSSTTNNQWYYNGQPIPNATSQIYTAITNGKYYVVVTSANGCTAKSDVKDIVTSILELANDLRFNVYPNPTTGKLNVSSTFKTPGGFNIRIVDLMGKSVYDKTENLSPGNFEKQIDLQGKASGIYFVIISSDGKQGMMKLILK